jgi:dTDP-4-amino-4,6-dideoxygalactose transaminase
VDKYTWVDIGSSYLPGEIIAAFLWAQLEDANKITQERLKIWENYHCAFDGLISLRRPIIPENCKHNAHMYYILLETLEKRTQLILEFKRRDISAVFHYVPLHSSPVGIKFGRVFGSMANTDYFSERLLRLPLWLGLGVNQKKVIELIYDQI